MNLVMITMPNCSKCRDNKAEYKAKGIELTEKSFDTEEGASLIEEYNVMNGGTIIDLDEKKIVR